MSELNSNWKITHRAASVATSLLMIYLLVSMIMLITGRQPTDAPEGITIQREGLFVSLLRMDYLAVPLYYLLFLGFFTALKKSHIVLAIVTGLIGFVGVTIFLAMPSNFSWVILNGEITSANVGDQKTWFQAAHGAILPSDLWQGTGSLLGKILIQTSLFLISIIMLRSNVFSVGTAWMGIAAHGLDLLHVLVGYLFPTGGFALMVIAGPLSLIWLLFLARDFFQLGNETTANAGYLGRYLLS